MLDDTAILEFLFQDYPRFVNALAFVSGDLRSAQDDVRGSLRRAWERDDRGSPVGPLADWVLADVIGRRARRRRSRRAAARTGTAGIGVLGGIAPVQREAVVLCLYLRRDPHEATRILGMKDGELAQVLAETRRTLASSLEPREPDRDAVTLDRDLERWLARAEHPVPVVGVFDQTLHERARRARGRRARTLVLSLAVVAAVAAGLLVASSPAPHLRALPSATRAAPVLGPPPPPATSVPGIPYPACHVTRIASDFEGVRGVQTAVVFERARRRGPCAPDNIAATHVALVGAHDPVTVTLSGAIRCYLTCRAFSAPVFGSGPALLAVAVTSGQPADAIELYRARLGRSGTSFRRIASVVGGRRIPVAFDWGGVGIYRLGADCVGPARRRLDIWTAVLRHGVWMVQEQVSVLHGSRLGPARTRRSTVRATSELPSGGRDEFCGAPVQR